MSGVVIRAEDLGKRYRIGERERYLALRDILARCLTGPLRWFQSSRATTRKPRSEGFIWALKGVSLEVRRGEVVGVIGRNGAGKSTLLKVLSRITEPTEGYAEIRGRVGSLLEVGTGFHSELTGRENIYLNGAILGMRKAEIERKFDEIVAFAEVEKFIDTPVKHYSSGMYVRLAFAVAANLEPEILLVDEVLAVGDAAFQKKCLGKMGEVAKEGRTILFVSHNMAAILNLCKSAVMLEHGRIVGSGSVERVVDFYIAQTKGESNNPLAQDRGRAGSGLVRFKELQILNGEGGSVLYPSKAVVFKMRFETRGGHKSADVNIGLGINTPYGERLATLFTRFDRKYRDMDFVFGNDTTLVCRLKKFPLRPGMYYVSLYADFKGELADQIKDAVRIEVQEDDFFGTGVVPSSSQGIYLLEQEWIVTHEAER